MFMVSSLNSQLFTGVLNLNFWHFSESRFRKVFVPFAFGDFNFLVIMRTVQVDHSFAFFRILVSCSPIKCWMVTENTTNELLQWNFCRFRFTDWRNFSAGSFPLWFYQLWNFWIFFLLKIFNLSILGNFLWLVPQTSWSRTRTSKI